MLEMLKAGLHFTESMARVASRK